MTYTIDKVARKFGMGTRNDGAVEESIIDGGDEAFADGLGCPADLGRGLVGSKADLPVELFTAGGGVFGPEADGDCTMLDDAKIRRGQE